MAVAATVMVQTAVQELALQSQDHQLLMVVVAAELLTAVLVHKV
jgi:hypothetical protein